MTAWPLDLFFKILVILTQKNNEWLAIVVCQDVIFEWFVFDLADLAMTYIAMTWQIVEAGAALMTVYLQVCLKLFFQPCHC